MNGRHIVNPRARWRNAIGAARVLSRFGNRKGANNHKDRPVVSTDDEDDRGGGSTSWGATPKTDKNRQQQQLLPSSPDDRVPRWGLAGLVAAGATKASKDHASATAAAAILFNVVSGCDQEGQGCCYDG